ncbi:hypothetical protein IJ818_01470 [bacterium]|nr:hypothetical protein [bacterium]
MSNPAIEQLKSLYSQLFYLIEEVKELITQGHTNEAVQKASQIKNISKQLKLATKGTIIPEELKPEIKELEIKALNEIKETSDAIIQIKENLKNTLNTVNNNIKIQKAYSSELPQVGQTFYEEE